MFGYHLEENFDLAKVQRRDRLWWFLVAGICLLGVSYVLHAFPPEVFQGYFLTVLSYGDSFYVQRKDKLGEPQLWKAIVTTVPLHSLFLGGIVLADQFLPSLATKVVVSLPILFLCFGIETVLFDRIVDRFGFSNASAETGDRR